jgi:hypothetical protein
MSAIVAEFSIPLPDALVEIGQEHSSQQKLCLRLRTTFIVRILTPVLILRFGLERTLTLVPDARPLTKHDLYAATYIVHLRYANVT